MDFFNNAEWTEIPRLFYSDQTGLPFERCIHCDTYLLEKGKNYFIEKAIKQYPEYETQDTIFEYAICINCMKELQKGFSEESTRNVQQYMEENADFEKRRREFTQYTSSQVDKWLAIVLKIK